MLVIQIASSILGKSIPDQSDAQESGLLWKRVDDGKWVIELPSRIENILADSASHWRWDEMDLLEDTYSDSSDSDSDSGEDEEDWAFANLDLKKEKQEGYVWKKQEDGTWTPIYDVDASSVSMNPST